MNLNQYEIEMIKILREAEVGTLTTLHSVLNHLQRVMEDDKETWGADSWQYIESKQEFNKFVELMAKI